jgi:aspartate kinase
MKGVINLQKIKAVKFGGSSLADAVQFKKAADIIKADPERRYVVPSAPGKRHKDDDKVTDLLYKCYDNAATGTDFNAVFDKIAERYREIIKGLELDYSLEDEFAEIKNAFINKEGRDYAASRGEYLNAKIMAEYLGYNFIDAADVIYFNEDGIFDSERTNMVLKTLLKYNKTAVIPGFYGSAADGKIKTFSRGGSDITGSIIARAVKADIYENWTDVSGFLTADPRIIDNPKPIEKVTYRELRELSYMGATVLHEDAIFPVRTEGIPINIRNTNDPDNKGTMITADANADASLDKAVITGLAGKKGFSVVTIEKDMMNSELGFGRRVLEVLEKNKVSFEHLPSGIDTMSIIIATSALDGLRDKICEGIREAVLPDHINIEDGLALVAVVGRGMIRAKGTAARVFKAIAAAGVNIRMIDQGSSELNIIVGIDQNDFEKALHSIYNEFIK